MEGQKLMKHSKHLINCPVHVTTMEWARPDIPRAGIITGYGAKEGLFNVAVFSDHSLDIRIGKSPILYVNNVLVVDDDDDTPVGVHQYARIYQQPMSTQILRHIDQLYKSIGAPAEPEQPEELEKVEDDSNDKVEDDSNDKVEDDSNDKVEDDSNEKVEDDSNEKVKDPEGDGKHPPLPAGTPIQKLQKSPAFEPIAAIEGIFSTETGDNELSITIDDDEKPIARITWKDPPAGRALVTEPFGFTIKVRDSGGRCSRTMGLNVPRPEKLKPILECVAGAIKSAMEADLGDFGSSTENMTEWVNKAVAFS